RLAARRPRRQSGDGLCALSIHPATAAGGDDAAARSRQMAGADHRGIPVRHAARVSARAARGGENMTQRIEDYALIGDCKTAALVGIDGSIDWLSWPRFDSAACFAALLGTPENGRWLISPNSDTSEVSRRYRPGTLVLETEFRTQTGTAVVIDFMVSDDAAAHLVRIVMGRSGRVAFHTALLIRFGYGATIPWVTRPSEGVLDAIAGPDHLVLRTRAPVRGNDMRTVAEFSVAASECVPFVLSYCPSSGPPPAAIDALEALARTESFWREWSGRCLEVGPWTDAVRRSLITLKALTYSPTGGIVAAATTSLPE